MTLELLTVSPHLLFTAAGLLDGDAEGFFFLFSSQLNEEKDPLKDNEAPRPISVDGIVF